jgi:ADP-dependent NAD(P)H-hydrate dehydratase / NAD(P)H-hydrate epimerase
MTVTADEMRAIERTAMAEGWTEESLMNLAGTQLGLALARQFPQPGTLIAYLGKGHNAGDALVAARILRDRFGWHIILRAAFPDADWAPLTREKWLELGAPAPLGPLQPADLPPRPWLLLDGLLGIGGSGPLRPPLLGMAAEMQQLRTHAGARLAAVDLPSGVHPDDGRIFSGSVVADITFMIGCAKRGLLTAQAMPATGALAIVPVPPLTSQYPAEQVLIAPQSLDIPLAPRPFEFHKGQAGRVGILAGSSRYAGAAVLTASAALRAGAGLVTLHAPGSACPSISHRCPPELIISPCDDPRDLLGLEYDSWVIGCGLHPPGEEFADGLLALIDGIRHPAVLDAEALNLIARRNRQDLLAAHHLVTPHPGEFRRLAPDLADLPREQAARHFARRFPATLLLKGSRTLVARGTDPLRCNSTGSPGMATGGQGDLLAGVVGALLPHHDLPNAASLAAWLCGRAAERALLEPGLSEESLLPSDLLQHLGGAFSDWRSSAR